MKTSIIILSYNQVDYTLACIDSIKKFTNSYEIIVVDNNSDKHTIDKLEEIQDIILIKNKINKGFPGGCNDGIKVATGDNILLLNNDTIVTRNWLDNLIAALYSNNDIGAVGPVTNSCSNFQTIPCEYSSLEDMLLFAEQHNKSNSNLWESRDRLIGFALLIKKDILNNIGMLDEQFFPGNFEDDDLSLRIRLNGYKLLLCKDTFIHHFGSTSFTKESSERFSKTLQINEKKFLQKWNIEKNEIFNPNIKKINIKKEEEEIVSFIYVVNDEDLFEKSKSCINNLIIPNGISIEIIKLKNENNIFSAYNKGMELAKGKYKVYLHQDTFIENINFINDLIFNFNYDKTLGLIGLVGAKKLPANGIWWESSYNVGEVIESHTGSLALLKFNEPQIPFEPVEAIDGFLMATQYDIPWREDLFNGWHFYDISQSQEFLRAGYKVGVPSQIKSWSIHDCGVVNTKNGYEESRKIFLSEYGKKMPLVSILIPTYNRPEYLEIAIKSALSQTYTNIEIIVCDDGDSLKTKEVVGRYPTIKYFKNEVNLGHTKNYKKCFQLANGEFIAYLMDDDEFYPSKVETMVNIFLNNPSNNISLVTSKRNLIDSKGNTLIDSFNTPIVQENALIDGFEAGNFMLKNIFNFIGEPTTPIFKRKDVENIFIFADKEYNICSDMITWLQLLSKGNIVYLVEPLSSFRLHEDQGQKQKNNEIIGAIELAHQVLNARKYGFLKDSSDYKDAIKKCIIRFDQIYEANSEIISKNFEEFLIFYSKLLKENDINI
jgi:GT2 family glycosyltransferase